MSDLSGCEWALRDLPAGPLIFNLERTKLHGMGAFGKSASIALQMA